MSSKVLLLICCDVIQIVGLHLRGLLPLLSAESATKKLLFLDFRNRYQFLALITRKSMSWGFLMIMPFQISLAVLQFQLKTSACRQVGKCIIISAEMKYASKYIYLENPKLIHGDISE